MHFSYYNLKHVKEDKQYSRFYSRANKGADRAKESKDRINKTEGQETFKERGKDNNGRQNGEPHERATKRGNN